MAGPSAPTLNSGLILWKYPEDFTDEKTLKNVAEFSFPCKMSDSLPWSELFYKLLNHIASIMNVSSSRAEEVEALLVRTYHQEIPLPGDTFVVDSRLGLNKMECVCPDDSKLPRIPDNRHLTEYYNAVDDYNMRAVWASMLCERRVIFVSSKLGRLSSCVIAANLLIYPMHWQHIFIPVLPEHLFDYLHAPIPFIIGVTAALYTKTEKAIDLNDTVVLNIDTKEFHSPFNDLASFPSEVTDVLKKNLKNSNHLLGDGVSRSFLRALVVLIGGYREALTYRPGEKIGFSEDKFITTRPPSIQPFLKRMLELQIFTEFKNERLILLNEGGNLRDEFEEECNLYSGKEYNKMKYQYQQYVGNVKKDAHEFVRAVQDKAKTSGKNTFKNIKEKFNEIKAETAPRLEMLNAVTMRKNQSASSIPSSTLDQSSDEANEGLFKYEPFPTDDIPVAGTSMSATNIDLLKELNPMLSQRTSILDQLEKTQATEDDNLLNLFPNGRLKNSKSFDHLLQRSIVENGGVQQQSQSQRPIDEMFPKCFVAKSRTSSELSGNNESLLIDFGVSNNGLYNKHNNRDIIFDPLLDGSVRTVASSTQTTTNTTSAKPSDTNTKSNVDLLVDFFSAVGASSSSSSSNRHQTVGNGNDTKLSNGSKSNENIFESSSLWETFE